MISDVITQKVGAMLYNRLYYTIRFLQTTATAQTAVCIAGTAQLLVEFDNNMTPDILSGQNKPTDTFKCVYNE